LGRTCFHTTEQNMMKLMASTMLSAAIEAVQFCASFVVSVCQDEICEIAINLVVFHPGNTN